MGLHEDPIQVCGYPFPANLLQMLASCLVLDADDNVLGFRVTFANPEDCTACKSIGCDYSPQLGSSPETLVVLGFGVDDCGKLAIKLVNCDDTLCESCEDRPQ